MKILKKNIDTPFLAVTVMAYDCGKSANLKILEAESFLFGKKRMQ